MPCESPAFCGTVLQQARVSCCLCKGNKLLHYHNDRLTDQMVTDKGDSILNKEQVRVALEAASSDTLRMSDVSNSDKFFDLEFPKSAIDGRNSKFTEVERGVYVPDHLLKEQPELFSDENGVRTSGIYAWCFIHLNDDDNWEFINPLKFGQFGTDAANGKLPHETISGYEDNPRFKIVLLWAASTDEILASQMVMGNDPEERKLERARKNIRQDKEKKKTAKKIEDELRRKYMTNASREMGRGTEWVEESPGEIIEILSEYLGAKHIADVAGGYKMRDYIEENESLYEEFLAEVDGVEVDKDGYILAATTGLGKTAMALRMLLDYGTQTESDEKEGIFHAIFSSMPDTLRNFIDNVGDFPDVFTDKNGNQRFKFYGGKSVLKELEDHEHSNLIHGGAEEFAKAKENNESGHHVMLWSVQDVKDKTDYGDVEEVSQEEWDEFEAELTGKYSIFEDFEWDVLVFDEAHHATDTKRMYKSLECFGTWHHRILLSATPQIYFEYEDPIHRKMYALSRDEVYRRKKRGVPHFQNRPDYIYRFLAMRDAIRNLREELGLESEDEPTMSKWHALDEQQRIKLKDRLKALYKLILNIHPDTEASRIISPLCAANGVVDELCEYSKRVGMILVPEPAGGGEGGTEKLVGQLANELLPSIDDSDEFVFLNVYNEDDIQKLEKFGEKRANGNVGSSHPWKGKKVVLITHRKKLTGYDEEQLGWMMIMQDIGTASLLEQATGRVGREGPVPLDSDAPEKLKKRNCAVYMISNDGGFEVLNKRCEAEQQIQNRQIEPDEYAKELRNLYDIRIAKAAKDGNVRWEEFNFPNFVDIARRESTSEEKSLTDTAAIIEKLQNGMVSPENITDADSGSGSVDLHEDQSGGSDTKNNSRNQTQSNSSSDDEDKSDLERQSEQVKNFLERCLKRVSTFIKISNVGRNLSFKEFIKKDAFENEKTDREARLSNWIDAGQFGLNQTPNEALLYYYNEGVFDEEDLHVWFANQK